MTQKIFPSLFVMAFLFTGFSAQALTANADAPKGGTINLNYEEEPTSLHPILSTDAYSSDIHALACDSLLSRDASTYDFKPRIATSWEISKDGKQYTFKLREGIFFHDGKPITAEDVKFTFEAFVDPKLGAAHWKPYFEGISKVEAVDPKTIRFTVKDTYFNNFNIAAGTVILPKHVYGEVEKSKKLGRSFICSGPYKFEKFERGQILTLKKDPQWFGNTAAEWKGFANFNQINIRFYKDTTVQIERIKKGDIDYIVWPNPESFVKKAVGPEWGKKVFKFKVENKVPKGYGFIGWNLRKPLFQDKNVRLALAHLANRNEMNKKFRYGMSDLVSAPIYSSSEYAPAVKPIEYNPAKARELLTQAGWTDTDKDSILDKVIDGKKTNFQFSLNYASKETEKYWTMYKEDLKKAGIVMDLNFLEWNSFIKQTDEGSFDALSMGWGNGSVDPDPKQVWHSSSAVKGGSNFINYKNAEVDKLIEEGRMTLDKPKRIALLKKAYEKIAEDAPYLFLFSDRYQFYATTAKIAKPGDTFVYDLGIDTWWMKP